MTADLVDAPERSSAATRLFGAVRGTLRALRDAWLILGLTVAVILVLEAVYRAQSSARRALRGETAPTRLEDSPNHPNAREPWWEELAARREQTDRGVLRYDPFRGWWPGPQSSRYVNVDAGGLRVTVQPPRAAGPRRVVYMFGGSAMWGWRVRDAFTIPSLVASRLHALGYRDVEVVNLAQSTYDLSQNAATLMREIRHGRVPAVAVFLDGNNEVAPVFQSGEVGRILNEGLIARRFERQTDARTDLMAVLRHLELVQRLTSRAAPPAAARRDLCREIAGSYERQVRALSAVAAAFRFEAIFLWQPMLATTSKQQTAWERRLSGDSAWGGMVRRCTAAVDSALASAPVVSYYPLHGLFDRDSTDVFIDNFGHVTERANGLVADSIASLVALRLGR